MLGLDLAAGRLYDLYRLERMILHRVTREYFRLNKGPHGMTEELVGGKVQQRYTVVGSMCL